MVRRRAVIQCEYCDKRFTTRQSYKSHQKKSHGVKKWSCEFCGRCFAERGTLTNHRRTHTKETPFSCELCGRRFSHRATLLNHKKTHSDTKEHQCTHCQKKFHRKSNMNRHIQVVHLTKQRKGRRRRPAGMASRSSLSPPLLASDSSDGSPMQRPLRMPPRMPPPPLFQLPMRQMGFPQNFRREDFMRCLPKLPLTKLPEKVTLSVTYEQQQKAARQGFGRSTIDFQCGSLRSLSGSSIYDELERKLAQAHHHDEMERKLAQANMLPPALKFGIKFPSELPELPTSHHHHHHHHRVANGEIIVPPPLPPKPEDIVKEEPIDSYGPPPAAPPSLEHSRSTSPIIIGCDDLMMKGENDTPTPSPMGINSKTFSFSPKRGLTSMKLPTPMQHVGRFDFGGSMKEEEIHGMSPRKRDSIPDKLKMDAFSMADFAPDYVASQMTMTIQKPDSSGPSWMCSGPSPRTNIRV